MSFKNIIGLFLWFMFAKYLPKSTFPIVGRFSKNVRYFCVKLIFKRLGKSVNIENLSYFGSGFDICIGDFSGIGTRCRVPSNIQIGKYVMMAEEVIILNRNHNFDSLKIPLCKQGHSLKTKLKISDDVWIGTRVIILPGVTRIGKGVIIGAGSVVTKNIDDYSIVAGNPARLIKVRE